MSDNLMYGFAGSLYNVIIVVLLSLSPRSSFVVYGGLPHGGGKGIKAVTQYVKEC
jgi:hypothetical protein